MNRVVVERILTTWGPLTSAKILARGCFRFLPPSEKAATAVGSSQCSWAQQHNALTSKPPNHHGGLTGWTKSPQDHLNRSVPTLLSKGGKKTNCNSSPNAAVYKTRLGCRQTRAACLQVWMFGKKNWFVVPVGWRDDFTLVCRACCISCTSYTPQGCPFLFLKKMPGS